MRVSILLTLVLSAIIASSTPVSLEKRRFDQQKPPIIDEGAKLDQLPGLPGNRIGEFSLFSGQMIVALLAANDDCIRYGFLDNMVELSKLSKDPAKGIAIAQQMAALEKNFNPFLKNVGRAKPTFCPDRNVPRNDELRCIVPVIDETDPTLVGAAAYNQKAKQRLQGVMNGTIKPDTCAGQSPAEQVVALGFTDCFGCKKEDIVEIDNSPGKNLNQFTGSILGGSPAKITKISVNGPFQITLKGVRKDDVNNLVQAKLKACQVQQDLCLQLVKSAKGKAVDAKDKLCTDQFNLCKAGNVIQNLKT